MRANYLHILFVIPLCLLGAFGCTSTPEAKALSNEIVIAEAAQQKVSATINAQLISLSNQIVAQTIDAEKTKLQLIAEHSHSELRQKVNDAFVSGLYDGFDIIDNVFQAEIQKENASQPRQLQLAAEAEEAKVHLVRLSDQDRQQVLKDGDAAIDAAAAAAQAQIEPFKSRSAQLEKQLQASLDQVGQSLDALQAASKSLDSYIQRQSPISLVATAFLQQIGFAPQVKAIDSVVTNFTDQLTSKVDNLVNSATKSMDETVGSSSSKIATSAKATGRSERPASNAAAPEPVKPKPQ